MTQIPVELVITRTLNAPREQVWNAFTKAENLAQWWGPKGFTAETHRFDLSPGGMYLYRMLSPQGHEMWGRFVYQAVEPQERLAYVSSFSNSEGELTRAPFWDNQFPLEVWNEIQFEETDGKTTVTLRGRPHGATPEEEQFFVSVHPSMQAGFSGTLDQLEGFLAG